MTYFTLEGGSDGGQDNVALVTSLFDAFNAGDLDRAVGTVADDFELVDMAAGQTFRGPERLSPLGCHLPNRPTRCVDRDGQHLHSAARRCATRAACR